MKSHFRIGLSRQLMHIVLAITTVGFFCPTSESRIIFSIPRRHKFEIKPATPLKELLPTVPKTLPSLPPYLNEDLAQAAELTFGEPVAKDADAEKATAHIIAKINHLNQKDPDGFLKALIAHRADLHGLPFLMSQDCRTERQQAARFAKSVEAVRRLIHNIAAQDPEAASVPNAELTAAIVYREFPEALADRGVKTQRSQATQADVDRADVAALMQMFGPQPALFRVGLAKYLATIEHSDATRALAGLALFASEEAVQNAAINGLKRRPSKDYANVLMQGFRYPLPAVSKRAANALVKLRCQDVLADLVNVLEQPDPRAPEKQKLDGKDVTAVHEVVRVNHRRNCLLCHAPANTEDVPKDVLTVAVPLPMEPPSHRYNVGASPDIFVRTDMTYLRQDFSMMLPDSQAEPSLQRFDFLVRTRVLSEKEAAEFARQITEQGTPPSHLAAQYALRELTGHAQAEATPAAWRRFLNLSAPR